MDLTVSLSVDLVAEMGRLTKARNVTKYIGDHFLDLKRKEDLKSPDFHFLRIMLVK